MNKSKPILTALVLIISAVMTIITMYVYGSWQHERYWNGTIVRVNENESHVINNLLSSNISKIYSDRDFDKLSELLKPIDGKLAIRFVDKNGNIVFNNISDKYELGDILQKSQVQTSRDTFTMQILSYRSPSWHSLYLRWFSKYSEWFSMKYDFITMPSIAFFLIWSLFFTALIWRYKAHMENDRLFHVLREFKEDKDEEEQK